MTDILCKGDFKGLDMIFACAVTTQAINEVVVRHDCDPAGAHILGRAVTAALLAASVLPEDHRLNVCWKYSGALRTIVVDGGRNGSVRALISPSQLGLQEDAHDSLYGEIGNVQVVVSREGVIVGSGTTPVSLHDPVNDLAYHYSISDQVETGMSVMIGFGPDPQHPVRLCHGWMVQALPGCNLECFDRIRRRMDEEGFRDLLAHSGESDNYFEELAKQLVGDEEGCEGLHMEACSPPSVQCTCSREKIMTVVRNIPVPERMDLVKKNEPVVIKCRFCNHHYELDINECIAAWNHKPGP